jgi:hypothetical protein
VTVPGVAGPVAALETDFTTHDIDFEQATRFLEPVNWKKCMPFFWCEMKKLAVRLPPGEYRYHEIVSTDCPHKARAAFTAETDLDFSFTWLPDAANPVAAFTNYELSDGRPQPGDLIRVDEGTLLVSRIGPGPRPLRIITTKRIQFDYPFSSEALVLIMCAFGYANVAGDLLCCAATIPEGSGNKKSGTRFPGEPPTTVEKSRRPPAGPRPATAEKSGRPGAGRRKKAGPTTGDTPNEAATAVRECIEECADAARDWSRRMAEGPYTAPELVQDMASAWARMLREGATAVDAGFRGAGRAPRAGPRRRSAR